MKKRKIVKYLRQFVGHEIIRTAPILAGDKSYTERPILLVRFTPDGCIQYRYVDDIDKKIFGKKVRTLTLDFSDYHWISYEKALKAEDNRLNEWVGRKIMRKCPTADGNFSYTLPINVPTLKSASRYHIVLRNSDPILKKECVLGPEFSNPDDWQLVE